jgi:hypothetical protein
MTTPNLQRQYESLRDLRLNLRCKVDDVKKQMKLGLGDPHDGRQRIFDLELAFIGTNQEWEHLSLALGKRLYTQPVKIDLRARAAPAAGQGAPARPTPEPDDHAVT